MRGATLFMLLGAMLACGPIAGCVSGGGTGDTSPADMGPPPDLACYPDAKTYLELLNACTNAQAIDKTPITPKLNADGTLPSLP